MNKKNNKGFSLIELIVVVAIMAVLVGVLAPTYLRYVEKTRVQKDVSAVGEVVQAIKVAVADEGINTDLAKDADGVSYSIDKDDATDTFAATDSLTKELKAVVGDVTLGSNSVTSVAVKAEIKDGALAVTVTPTLTETDADLTADFTNLGTAAADVEEGGEEGGDA